MGRRDWAMTMLGVCVMSGAEEDVGAVEERADVREGHGGEEAGHAGDGEEFGDHSRSREKMPPLNVRIRTDWSGRNGCSMGGCGCVSKAEGADAVRRRRG